MCTHCHRCGAETNTTTTSYFSEERICMDCDHLERQHPDFSFACNKEITEIKAGNYNFKGIGAPPDLVEASQKARYHREKIEEATNTYK